MVFVKSAQDFPIFLPAFHAGECSFGRIAAVLLHLVVDGGHEEVMKRPMVKGIARVYSVCKWTVYRLAGQKRTTDIVALRTSQRGRKPVLTAIQQRNGQ